MNKIEFGDCRTIMRQWATEGVKVQTCVTSPPYYGLRDYGTGKWIGGDESCNHVHSENKHGGQRADRNQEGYKKQYQDICQKCGAVREDQQLGLEETPEEYIANMVEVFRCVKDILADDGTLWVNIGDSYCNSNGFARASAQYQREGRNNMPANDRKLDKLHATGLKTKDLIGIPWMLAFALRADGWYLRQDIIWHKPNPMPESVQDRCTKAHEYIFLLSKSPKYFYDADAIKEPVENPGNPRKFRDGDANATLRNDEGRLYIPKDDRNKRSVWSVPVKPYSGAHFAVFPSELIEPCIMAGSRVGDIVLDPFMGSGTTAQVAQDLNRNFLGCELNPDYKSLQDKRLRQLSLELA